MPENERTVPGLRMGDDPRLQAAAGRFRGLKSPLAVMGSAAPLQFFVWESGNSKGGPAARELLGLAVFFMREAEGSQSTV